jgi:hypothetical protein
LESGFDILGDSTNFEGEMPQGLGFLFPVPTMMRKHWEKGVSPVPEWDRLNSYYRRAEPLLQSALAKSRPEGKNYVHQLLGQVLFSIDYIDAVQEVRRARVVYERAEDARKNHDVSAYSDAMEETNQRLDRALGLLKKAIGEWAEVVRDPSDMGALATLNAFGYDYLKGVAQDVYLQSQFWEIHF